MMELDGLDALAERLTFKRLGWHRHVNTETGALALFPTVPVYTADSPVQRKIENAWEAKALAQNAESERLELANRLAAKPTENSLQERKRIMRGD